MTGILSRRMFLGAGLAALAAPVPVRAEAPARSLRPMARPARGAVAGPPGPQALIAGARLSGRVGYAVVDPATGRLLEAHDDDAAMPPASIAKALTALYALDALGEGYRFETRLIATGPVENGILKGDLVLAGGGDPTLDTNALAGMAAALKAGGLREVRGRFRVWGGAVPYRRAIVEDQPEHAGYNPALSGLNLNFNRVHFEWKRQGDSYAIRMDARSDRYRPDVGVARMRVAERAAPVYVHADGGARDEWSVARAALGNGGARWLPVRKPELYAGEVLATFARAQGIVLGTPEMMSQAPSGSVLVSHRSEALAPILRDMLRHSTNLTAEMVGMTASARRQGASVTWAQTAAMMNGWAAARLGMGAAALRDHSGLSDRSRLTASDMARGLAGAPRAALLRPLLRDFALRDARGTVARDHPVKVRAKTGTLYFVSTLAGYVTTASGRDLAFAILTASDSLRARIDPKTDDSPPGARDWNRRARRLQQALIERWSTVHG